MERAHFLSPIRWWGLKEGSRNQYTLSNLVRRVDVLEKCGPTGLALPPYRALKVMLSTLNCIWKETGSQCSQLGGLPRSGLDNASEQSQVECIVVIQGMSDCEQGLLVQERVQLAILVATATCFLSRSCEFRRTPKLHTSSVQGNAMSPIQSEG